MTNDTNSFNDLNIVLSKEQRQQNMTAILDTLKPEQNDFNIMVTGFLDIIQDTFYHYLASMTKSEQEEAQLQNKIGLGVSEVMKTLNNVSDDLPSDMVIMTTIMLEATAKAIKRQAESGQEVKKVYEQK